MVDIAQITMDEYKKRMRDNGPGLTQPKVLNTTNFELKGNMLAMFKDVSFYGKDHEDAYKNLDELKNIAN